MEAIKNCTNCYWLEDGTKLGHDICEICSDHSSISNPYPSWTQLSDEPNCPEEDIVNHPKHYTKHASGVECIQITEHMNFCLGNAIKYIWRAGDKHETPIEDLKKAKWYIEREIARLEKE